jgi:hypothetical protein
MPSLSHFHPLCHTDPCHAWRAILRNGPRPEYSVCSNAKHGIV